MEATAAERHGVRDFDRFGIAHGARHLARAIHKANRDVFDASQQMKNQRGMGSTIVATLFSPRSGQLHVAHVGDSRCYRLRQGHLEQMTRDHSLLHDVLEERPELEEAVLAKLPRNVVTRALGMASKTRATVASFDVNPGDRYLLCSDGLSGYVPSQTIADRLGDARPAGAIVQLLLNAADEAGGKDNVAVIVVECLEQTAPAQRKLERFQAEQRAASTRADQTSEPELLLVGIEELDVFKAVEALTGGELPADDDRALLDALLGEQDDE
jgi:serine/threonine protein phosphatase PrpC